MLLKGVFSKHGIITVVSLKQPSFKSALSRAVTGNGKGGMDHYFLIISVSIIALLSLSGGGSIFSGHQDTVTITPHPPEYQISIN